MPTHNCMLLLASVSPVVIRTDAAAVYAAATWVSPGLRCSIAKAFKSMCFQCSLAYIYVPEDCKTWCAL